MTKNNNTLVSDKTAKALGDETNWSQVYNQSDEETEEKAKSDPDALELYGKFYSKPEKLKNR